MQFTKQIHHSTNNGTTTAYLYSRSPPTFQVIAAAIISILNFPRHYTNKQQLYREDNQYALQRGFLVSKIHNSRLHMAIFCLFIKKPKSHLFWFASWNFMFKDFVPECWEAKKIKSLMLSFCLFYDSFWYLLSFLSQL